MNKKISITFMLPTLIFGLVACNSSPAQEEGISSHYLPNETIEESIELESEHSIEIDKKEDNLVEDQIEEEVVVRSIPKLNAKNVEEYIVGSWKLVSYSMNRGETIDYSDKDYIWQFDGINATIHSEDLGEFTNSTYSVRQAALRSDTCIVVQVEALRETHLPYGKLIVTGINNNKMTIMDWFSEMTYTLEYIQE